MKTGFLYSIILYCTAIILFSCKKPDILPIEPKIEYLGFIIHTDINSKDSSGTLIIGFEDGDGDLGLSQNDTFGTHSSEGTNYYNLFLTYSEKQKGEFVHLDIDSLFNYRMPEFLPNGEHEAIRGEIEVNVLFNPFSIYDTIQFSAYIIDRALHKSNIIITNEIPLNR